MKTRYATWATAAIVLTIGATAWWTGSSPSWAEGPATNATPATATSEPSTAPATQPKELNEQVKKGFKWLAAQQQKEGGWAQGEESANMGNSLDSIKDKPNVGDTCMAVMALLRSGSMPGKGDYGEQIMKGINFVAAEVEQADAETLKVGSVPGTRIQVKLGTNADTFLASLMLGEIRNRMPDEASRKRVIAALDKVMNKIEKNQKADGSFAQTGWATDLSQGLAAKSANVAAESGAKVNKDVLDKLTTNATGRLSVSGTATVTGGSAGVQLYAQGAQVTALEGRDRSLKAELADASDALAAASQPSSTVAPEVRENLRKRVDEVQHNIALNGGNLEKAQKATIEQAKDERFIAGFGSNGGEEFLSYLNLGESLFTKGGEDWKTWDKKITDNLNQVQNADGSWTGHHCITGRNFCTSAALMVLTIDRAPAVNGQIKRR